MQKNCIAFLGPILSTKSPVIGWRIIADIVVKAVNLRPVLVVRDKIFVQYIFKKTIMVVAKLPAMAP